MEIEKSEYENIIAALKSIVSSKIVNEKCEGTKKEQLLDFIIFFDNNGYTFFTQLKLSSIEKDNLLEDLKLIAEKIVKESVYNIKESEMMDVVDKYLRLYNNILLSLNDNEKIRLIQIKFDKQKSYIDKTIEEFDSLLESKKKEMEALSSSFLSRIDEKDKSLEEKVTHIENIESSFVALQNKINKSQDDFEKKIKDKQEKFHKNLKEQLSDFQDSIYRKKLSGYFLKERENLKGDINVLTLIITGIICLLVKQWSINALGNCVDLGKYSSWIITIGLFITTLVVVSTLIVVINSAFNKCKSADGFNFEEWINEFFAKDSKQITWMFTPYWGWLFCTFIGMCCILTISFELYNIVIEPNKPFNPNMFAKRFPLFMILIWFTWFCSKQFSYYKQICDEYEYKYLLSISYLSYRKEAQELGGAKENNVLLVSLLDSVIKNIATSPVQAVKQDCHTPFAEVANVMKMSFGKDDNNSSKN